MTCIEAETENQYPSKDPDSKLDFATRWVSWLDENEEIATSTWLLDVDPADLTPLVIASSPAAFHADGVAVVWLTGGTLGTTYTLVNRITTNQGRTEDRSKFVTIEQH